MNVCDGCEYRLIANGRDMCARPEKERICVKILNRDDTKDMIHLSTGAILDKSFDLKDFANGHKYSPKLGLLETFQPCNYCKNTECKRITYKECMDEYEKLWCEWKESNKRRTPRVETPLMKTTDEWISCATCWYHSPGYCARRERKARWNPRKFVCSDYGVTDKKFGQLKIDDFCQWTYFDGGRC